MKIITKLVFSYLLLIVCILVVGLSSYGVAAKTLMENYTNATIKSLDMLGEYVEYGLENVNAEIVNYLVDEEMISYLSGKMGEGEQLNYYNKQKTSFLNKVSSEVFISNVFFFSDKVPSLSSSSKSLENTYSMYLESQQGQQLTADAEKVHFLGIPCEMDEKLGVDSESYALRIVKKYYKKEAFVIVDIDRQAIVESLNRIRQEEGEAVVFVTADGQEIYQDGSNDNAIFGTEFYRQAFQSDGEQGLIENIDYRGKKSLFLYRKLEDTGAMVCVIVPDEILTSQVAGIQYAVAVGIVISFVLAISVAIGISGGMHRTVRHLVQNMNLIARGNMTIRMKIRGNSEFAQISGQMNQMLDSVTALLADVKNISMEVEKSAENVNESSIVIRESAAQIAGTMEEVEKGMAGQSVDTISCCNQLEGLAERIAEVVDKSDDIISITKVTELCIENSKESIGGLKKKAEETSLITHDIIRVIEGLQEKSGKIDRIMKTVFEIADETSLLSLNASIEAARAGAQGKGFQVIAEEIRKLAEQSMASTGEISSIVEDITNMTATAVETAQQAETTISRQENAVQVALSAVSEMIVQFDRLAEKVRAITQSATDMNGQKEQALINMESISEVTKSAAEAVLSVNGKTVKQEQETEKLTYLADEMQSKIEELKGFLERFQL